MPLFDDKRVFKQRLHLRQSKRPKWSVKMAVSMAVSRVRRRRRCRRDCRHRRVSLSAFVEIAGANHRIWHTPTIIAAVLIHQSDRFYCVLAHACA